MRVPQNRKSLYTPRPMITETRLRIALSDFSDSARLRSAVAKSLRITPARLMHFEITRRSIDARKHPPVFELQVKAWVDEKPGEQKTFEPKLNNVSNAQPVIVVGAGPAGLFAAIRLIELGMKPIILERGKEVRARRHDIARITKEGVVNPDSNYCFGEGGAGTFSDGKLYTRSTKRGSVKNVLQLLAYYGAQPEILIDAHPHIGTNRLPKVIQAMRKAIVECGGEIHFDTRLSGLSRSGAQLRGVTSSDGNTFEGRAVILATGHSARDIFFLLEREQLLLELKPFALGVRVEHSQEFVDQTQYRVDARTDELPAASYALRHQATGRGVFSFCMCPGGIICPAATCDDEVVVNGWSPSKRNSRYANSGIVVELTADDLADDAGPAATAGIRFQQRVERAAAIAGGGKQVAPAQRLTDFLEGRPSTTVPRSSYIPGLAATDLRDVLPESIHVRLAEAFRSFNRKMKGFIQDSAVLVGVESRTSSPVRIPRDEDTLMHPGLPGLFPCGEGAGYAGGIVSAAMDGERSADAVKLFFAR